MSVRDTGSGIDPEIAHDYSQNLQANQIQEQDWDYISQKVLLRRMEEKFGPKITLMEEGQHSVLHYQ